jgi:hypothetical protein
MHFVLGNSPEIQKIMVVGHDCKYYTKLGKNPTIEQKKADIVKAAELIKSLHPKMTVTAFFGTKKGKEVTFEQLV